MIINKDNNYNGLKYIKKMFKSMIHNDVLKNYFFTGYFWRMLRNHLIILEIDEGK